MKELRLVLLGLAALVALVLGAGFLQRALTLRSPGAPAVQGQVGSDGPGDVAANGGAPGEARPARAEIERGIAEAPDYGRFFDRLRVVFPDDYASIMSTLAAAARPGAVNADLVMADAVAALRRARGTLATRASDGALTAIFAMQLREMQMLGERDPHLCVAFLYGTNGNGFLAFAADHRALVADAAIAGLDAMNSGRTEPVVRTAPSDADFQALDGALVAKGLTRPQIDALLDGKSADPPIADADMCRAGQTYLGTLAAMPADARARLYALAVDLMAKS